MTDGLKGTKPLITFSDIHFIQINSKTTLSYLTAILIFGRFCSKVVSIIVCSWKIISIRFIFLNRMKFGLFVVQLSRTDHQDKDNGQHTGSVIPRFGHSSWGTLSWPSISLIACSKIQKQMWLISIIAYTTSKLIDTNCHYKITKWFNMFGMWPGSW